jgi:hypothetical protein
MDEDLQIKKLDALFFLFREEEVGIRQIFIEEMMLGKGYNVSGVEIKRYIDQLLDDKYIMSVGEGEHLMYIIRIEGLLFDGYEQQIISRISENERLEKLESDQMAIQTNMQTLTFWIALGAIVAAAYYLYYLIIPIYDHFFYKK